MAPIEPVVEGLRFVSLDVSRVDDAVALSTEAGWNQTADDWTMMLEQGKGFGYESDGGGLVASSIILPCGDAFGWISMVLVTGAFRKKRVATKLLEICIRRLEKMGLAPVLDATPAGARVYKPLGFKAHFGLSRWQGDVGPASSPTDVTRAVEPNDLAAILALDGEAFGGGRGLVIRSLMQRAPAVARVAADGSGFVLARDGRGAMQIGPLAAADETVAGALLNDALAAAEGPVFIDVPDDKAGINAMLEDRGFTVQRPFTRMAKGRTQPFGDPTRLFAVAGPELG